MKSPNLTKRTNHHKPTKAGPCWRPKITTKKNKLPPQPDGAQKGRQKSWTQSHANQSINAAETLNSIQKDAYSNTLPAHTNQQTNSRLAGQQTNQHTTMHTKIKNKYIGTLLSSQTTSTHHKKINQTLTSHRRLVPTYPTTWTKSNPRVKSVQKVTQK